MKLKVSDIADGEVLNLAHRYDAGRLDIEFDDLHYTEPIQLEAQVRRDADMLHFVGRLSSRIEQRCARCLKDVVSPIAHSVDLIYDAKDKQEIDATDDVREVLLLEHSPKFLCREDCRGLCFICGADLNTEQCRCKSNQG